MKAGKAAERRFTTRKRLDRDSSGRTAADVPRCLVACDAVAEHVHVARFDSNTHELLVQEITTSGRQCK